MEKYGRIVARAMWRLGVCCAWAGHFNISNDACSFRRAAFSPLERASCSMLSFRHIQSNAVASIPQYFRRQRFCDIHCSLFSEFPVFEVCRQGGEALAYDVAEFCLCRTGHALHLRGLEAEVSPVREGSVWGQMTFVGDFT